VVRYWRTNEGESRDMEELAKRGMDQLHIRFEGHAVPFPDLLKAERSCQVMMRQFAWIADYPDGDDFMQLFYGPNIHANNVFCFQDAEWDRLYQESVALGPGEKRDQLYQKMARMVEMYGVMKISHARLHHELLQAKVMGFHISTIASVAEWPYLDLR
jgi:ABC-type oligopeptide transport system substrate-binding subunit